MELEGLSPEERSVAAELADLTAEPSPERRSRIMAAVRSSPRGPVLARPWRLAAAALAAIAILGVGSIGVAAASRDALPNSPNYSVRQIEEQIQLGLADPPAREELRISFAERRIQQAHAVLQRGDLSNARALLRDSREYLAEARQNLAGVSSGEQGNVQSQLNQAEAHQANEDSQVNQQGSQGSQGQQGG